MARIQMEMFVGNQRRCRATATWPRDVPELGVSRGDPYNLAAAARVWFTAKAEKKMGDEEAVILKDTQRAAVDQITFDGNVAYFDIHETDTDRYLSTEREVKLYCDLQIRTAGGETWTVADGELKLKPRVTKATE